MSVYVTSMPIALIFTALITVRVILVLLEMVKSVPVRKSCPNDSSSLFLYAQGGTQVY